MKFISIRGTTTFKKLFMIITLIIFGILHSIEKINCHTNLNIRSSNNFHKYHGKNEHKMNSYRFQPTEKNQQPKMHETKTLISASEKFKKIAEHLINKKKGVIQKIDDIANSEIQRIHDLKNNSLNFGSRFGSFLKSGVGLISSGLRGMGNIIYDRDAKIKRQQIAKQMSQDIILDKIKFFESILRSHPDMTEIQMYRIAYFIGRQRGAYFKHYKNTQITKGIEKFLALTKSENSEIDKNYSIFIFHLIYLNELSDTWAFKLYETLNPMISSNFMKIFQEFFDMNEKPLFEDSNCDCQTGEISKQVEQAKIKIPKIETHLKKESEIESDTLSGADESERKLHELAFIENIKILSSQINELLSYPKKMQHICENNFDLKFLKISFNNLQEWNPAGKNIKDLEFNRELNIEIFSSILKFEKGMMDALELNKLKDKLETLTLHKMGGPMDVLMSYTLYSSSFGYRSNASHIKKLSEALLIAGNIASISPRQIKRKIWNSIKPLYKNEIKTARKLSNLLSLHAEKAIINFNQGVFIDNSSFIGKFFDNYSLDNWVYENLKSSNELFKEDLKMALVITKHITTDKKNQGQISNSDIGKELTQSWNISYWHNMKAYQLEWYEILKNFHESHFSHSSGGGSSESFSRKEIPEEKRGFVEYLKNEMNKEVPIDNYRDYDEGINGGFTA